MSRPVRIEFPGASYHVTNKGRDGQIVFRDDDDRGAFLNVLENVVERFEWLIHSYILMTDHYDLVVEVPGANLSKGMRQLNGVYTQHFNRRHGQEGPIFQGRFKSVLFEKKNYLLPVCRHVVINPARETESNNYASYKWSSYRALAGQVKVPTLLHKDDVLANFSKRDKDAQRKYREYVKQGMGMESPLASRTSQVLLGSTKFLNEMQPILQGERLSKRGPKSAKRRRSLNVLFKKVDVKTRPERNELIKKAHLDHGYTLMEIGDHLGLHYTTVSKVINA
ncbi:MAG: addiction module toxin RelE [Gammaproteobacteria bacterium]|jgi:putative transposase|nr:addiction module toxin RelE [Gammaproteobacteria bacterium]MBT4493245.1 addiction module toxin RelE [Gammaproteobacteria bacterium]MBT7369520.1 addiction module toxin RelE [Gammaproteobacteria bacterium]